MRRRRWRGHLSPGERNELWRRLRQGESLSAIARALDRRCEVLHRVLAGTGGFPPADLNRIVQRLNTRPRKTLGYRTPAAILAAAWQ